MLKLLKTHLWHENSSSSTLRVISHIDLLTRSLFKPSKILLELLGSLKKNLLPLEADVEDKLEEDLDWSNAPFFSLLANDGIILLLLIDKDGWLEANRCISALNVSVRDHADGVFISKSVSVDKLWLSVSEDEDEDEDEEDEEEDEDDDVTNELSDELSVVWENLSLFDNRFWLLK